MAEMHLESVVKERILLRNGKWDDDRMIVEPKFLDQAPFRWVCALQMKKKDGYFVGTGFLISGFNIVLTCAHNLTGATSVEITFPGKLMRNLVLKSSPNNYWTDPVRDFAALRIPASFNLTPADGMLTKLDQTLEKDEDVWIYGYPLPEVVPSPSVGQPVHGEKTMELYKSKGKSYNDWPILISGKGNVKSCDGKEILHLVNTEGGNSGGPIMKCIDCQWYAVGIHLSGHDDGSHNEGVIIDSEFLKKVG